LMDKREVLCDCDLIYDTVVEMEDILTEDECEILIQAACDRAAKVGWGEVRHANFATQDVKVWNMDSAMAVRIFRVRLVEPMRIQIAEKFGLPLPAVQVDDGFVVRYTEGAQTSLRFHRDGSIVSAIVSLSEPSDYEGGGTAFKDGSVYRPGKGCGILFGGQRLHAGVEITGGTRYICTLFFKCGEFSCRDVAEARDTEVVGEKFWGEMNDFFGGLMGSS